MLNSTGRPARYRLAGPVLSFQAMHERNNSLIERAHVHLGRGAKDLRTVSRERLTKLLDDYELAAKLSHGPDATRASHWSVEAQDNEARLKRCIESLDRHEAIDDCGEPATSKYDDGYGV